MTSEKSKKYKIAIITSHPIQYQAPFFRKIARVTEIDLTVFFYSDFGLKEKEDPEFGVSFKWDIPLLGGYKYKFIKNYFPGIKANRLWLSFNPGIIKEIWRGKYDAILIHGYASITNWLVLLVAKLKNRPILFRGETTIRTKQSKFKKIIKRILLTPVFKRIDVFLPIGKRSKTFYLSYKIPENKMFLTPYAVDNEFFMKQAARWKGKKEKTRTELGIPKDVPIILYVSKMTKRKRPMDLLLAFEKLKNKAALVFIGDGELRPALKDYAKKNKISNVFFPGFKNQSELPEYYSLADIFVLPSSYEPWGLVLNEAMCFGLPIIATKETAAVDDLVHQQENGFIYLARDIEKLIQHLDELLADSVKRKQMGKRSFQIISNWNYEASLKNILTALSYVKKL